MAVVGDGGTSTGNAWVVGGRRSDPLCEREPQMATARAALAGAAAGAGTVLVVQGSPGIGKTRLLEAIAESAAGAGFEVHQAAADEFEGSFAYGLLRPLVAPCLARLDPGHRAVILDGPASVLASIVEGTGERRTASREDEPLAVAFGLYRLIQDLGDRGPQALLVDDVHWADTPSLEALAYLARRVAHLPLLAAFACRAGRDADASQGLERLLTSPGARRIDLGPLSEAAVATLTRSTLPDMPASALSRTVWEATGGNPFLVRQLLAALVAGHPSWDRVDVADVEHVVPDAIAESVRRRITAIGQVAVRLAEAVAVLGDAPLHDAAVLDGSPRVLTRILALTELGELLRRDRQPRAARETLRTAMDLAHRHGATMMARRAREELVVAGGRPRREAALGPGALTPSERRVAHLVVRGLTNRQIAQDLFVSPRTISTHLTHVYQKLGVTTRAELATALVDDDR